MINTIDQQTTGATILRFPVKARLATSRAVQQVRFANEAAMVNRVSVAMPTTGWYHDEAVTEGKAS